MPSYCVVPNCLGNKSGKKLSQYTPPNEVYCKKWANAIGVPSLKRSHRVCERHFKEECVVKYYIKHDNDGKIIIKIPLKRSRLQPGAIPTIFDQMPTGFQIPKHIDHSYAVRSSGSNSEPLKPSEIPKSSVIKCDTKLACSDIESQSERNKISNRDKEDYIIDENITDTAENCSSNLPEGSLSCETTPEVPTTVEKDVVPMEVSDEVNIITSSSCTSLMSQVHDNSNSNLINSDNILPDSIENSKETSNKSDSVCPVETVTFESVSFNFLCQSNDNHRMENAHIKLPKTWNVCKNVFGNEEILIFTKLRVINECGIKKHILEKSLILNSMKEITYEVLSSPADITETKLPKLLDSPSMIPEILKKFENFRICKGIAFEKLDSIPAEALQQISTGQIWRHRNCKVISLKNDRCLSCKKIYRSLYQYTYKKRKKKTLKFSSKKKLRDKSDTEKPG